ncbi:MAG TPA: hypothetical protein VH253_06800 [Phycisphaerae bacterium]|nr:hypothetical protein [Phycisphaerae bacterium]
MPGDNARILDLARRLSEEVDGVVIGGIAVYLHGVARATVDLDLYTRDRARAARELEAAGARWDAKEREHVLAGISIHLVTPAETGVEVERASVIDGVRVVRLKDLVAMKLLSGLHEPARSKDLGDVEELIAAVGLDKSFAGRLPGEVRGAFKKMVEAVRMREGRKRF